MRILGLSAFYHDSAAALVEDGRSSRRRRRSASRARSTIPAFPHHALAYCLDEARLRLGDVDYVVFYDKPFLKFERLLETYLAFAPHGLPVVPHGDAAVAAREAVPEAAAARRAARSSSRDYRLGEQAAVHRASPEPRGLGVLSLAVRGGGRADHGRGRRVGDHVGRRSAAATISRSSRSSTSRIRSACSIRRSPITPASRSIPANTR